jgi:phosphodiesterase/alkaline phosphatase D-like protein
MVPLLIEARERWGMMLGTASSGQGAPARSLGGAASSRAKARTLCAAVVAMLAVSTLAIAPATASAVIVHLTNGKRLSYQPLAGTAAAAAGPFAPFDLLFKDLEYSGGPVMASNTNYAVYWAPSGAPAYPSDYQPGLNRYFEDLTHDSGGHENTESVAAQYNDSAGEFATYNSHFGGALIDTHAYPKNGCSAATICLTDAQIRAELKRYIAEMGLPHDLAHEYFVLTPPKVEDCFEASSKECSVGSSAPAYCAYHGNVPLSEGEIIYSNDPYVTNVVGQGGAYCEKGNHPNGTSSDGALAGGLSHEHAESITDPEPNNAWTDWATGNTTGYEIGDKCGYNYGSSLGKTTFGEYNQLINGHTYFYQQEWSNQGHECLQRLTFKGAEPTASFTSTPSTGNVVQLDATGSTAPGGISRYDWQFNAAGPSHNLPGEPYETTSPTSSVKLPAEGTYTVALTIYAADGTSAGTARLVQARATSSPTVLVEAASSVKQTEATLNGKVNPNGSAVTECVLEYGPTTAYGKSTPCAPAPGAGSTPVTVSGAVTGLEPNSTYHFRVTATNTGGTSSSTDTTLKTLPNAPAVVAEAASLVKQAEATLNAKVNANGATVTECVLEYGPTTSYGKSAPCAPAPGAGTTPVAVSATITGLERNSTYHFRVTATNTGGTSSSSDTTLKTLPNPPAVQTEPASAIKQTEATLNAKVNPNGSAVTECVLEYGPTSAYGKSTPCAPAPGAGTTPVTVSATVTGLEANSTYHFRVTATNSGGTTSSTDTTLKTLPNPPAVQTEPASAIKQTEATLNAKVNPNGANVTECVLEYGPTSAYGKSTPCAPAPGAGTTPVAASGVVTGLEANSTYHFRVTATSSGGTTSSTDTTLKTLPNPPTVQTEPASLVKQTEATLNAKVNPNGSAVTECVLEYGSTVSYGKSAPCAPAPGGGLTPVAVSATITSLEPNSTYHFRVTATNTGGTSSSTDATSTTLPNPPTVQTEPASQVKQAEATLNAKVNPNGATVTECVLEYGSTTSYGQSAPCVPAPGAGTTPVAVSATVTGLEANSTYHFRVTATNTGGTSSSTDATSTTLPNPPTVQIEPASLVKQAEATLNAKVDPNGSAVTECVLEYGSTVSYGKSTPCAPAPGAGTTPVAVSATVTSLEPNSTYHFRVTATNTGGTTSSTDTTLKTLPNAPAVVAEAAFSVKQTEATLNAKVNPNGDNVTECVLEYGSTVSYGQSAPCAPAPGGGTTPVAVSATVTSLGPNSTYHFRVTATNTGGTSSSTDATFTTLPAAPPPTVTKLSAKTGPAAGGTSVTITGTNLTGAISVEFGSTSASFTAISATSVTAISPAAPPGTVYVTVVTPSGASPLVAADRFKFTPTVTGVSPNAGATAGKATVTVTGSGFALGTTGTTFRFGTTRATSVNCTSTTQCAVATPAHASGIVDVVATVTRVASPKVAADRYTYS